MDLRALGGSEVTRILAAQTEGYRTFSVPSMGWSRWEGPRLPPRFWAQCRARRHLLEVHRTPVPALTVRPWTGRGHCEVRGRVWLSFTALGQRDTSRELETWEDWNRWSQHVLSPCFVKSRFRLQTRMPGARIGAEKLISMAQHFA